MRKFVSALLPILAVCATILAGLGCDFRPEKCRPPECTTNRHSQNHPSSNSLDHGFNTYSNYIASVALPFYTRYWVTPFLASEEANKPYSKMALQLLEADAFGMAANWKTGLADIRSLTPALINAGCTYPVIRWMYAMHLAQEDRTDEALNVLLSLSSEMDTPQTWPSPWRILICSSIRNLTPYAPEIEGAASNVFFGALKDGTFKETETRVAWRFLCACDMESSTGLENILLSHYGAHIDPWFALMLQGVHGYNKAWTARGTGFANTVTNEGWEGFGNHITQSQKFLSQAWALHPEIPETACEMIHSSRGDSKACRLWFDRAIHAEIDNEGAYYAYRFTLRPRWGGSLDQMEALADEAYNTGRFDTDAPLQAVFSYFEIADELREDWQDIFRKPGVYEKCKRAIDARLNRTFDNNRARQNHFNTALAYAAFGAGDFDTAGQALSRLNRPLTGHLAYENVRPPVPLNFAAKTAIRGLTGPNKERMREIHLLTSQQRNQDALDAIATLQPLSRLSDSEEDYLGYLEVELNARTAKKTKNRISLLPSHGSRSCQGPWINYDNSWGFTGRTLTAAKSNSRLGTTVFLPRNGIFEVTFSTMHEDPKAHSHFGLALDSRLGTNGEEQGPAFSLSRESDRWNSLWCSRYGLDSRKSKMLASAKHLTNVTTNTFQVTLRSNDDRVSATVNGELLFDGLDVSSAFHDKFSMGRLPFLFGENIIITRLDFTPL